jgi:L-amino acid N-acyltransferase YncA
LPRIDGSRDPEGDVTVQIVPLTEKDHNAVRTLELFCMREYLEPSMTMKWADLPADLMDQLGASAKQSFNHYRESGLSFVTKEKDKVVGFIFAQMVQHLYNIPKMVWVENMGVHPDHRRKGIAYQMLKKVVLEGKKKGAKAVHSAIMPDNAKSIMLHKKLGFFVDGRKTAFLDLESFR